MQLETKNLIGRPIAEGDGPRMRILHNDERVMATLSADGKKLNRNETSSILGRFILASDGPGRGMWVFHTRIDGTFTGYCGSRKYQQGGLNEIEILYTVPWAEWKKGYATEMAKAVVAHVFATSSLTELVSFTLPTNAASRRVMGKTGFEFERDYTHAGLTHVLYRLTRTRWTTVNAKG
ncbi:MAG: N-acetyltransferase [Rhodospirillaceae bacterium]|nr:N-acetyltransferase [Rhodospirillaceae bacterium]